MNRQEFSQKSLVVNGVILKSWYDSKSKLTCFMKIVVELVV